MKLTEIQCGEYYAASILPRQVEDAWPGPPGAESLGGEIVLGNARRGWSGYRVLVLGIEENERGCRVVRVEFVAHSLRRLDRREDNYDGTWTDWTGWVVDEDGKAIEDEEAHEAVIQPSQVKETWDDATVRGEMWKAERFLRNPDWLNEWREQRDG